MKAPIYYSQVDENGSMEKVDITIYTYKILCEEAKCLNVRYVKGQDRTAVKYCKLHAKLRTLKKRADRAKVYRKNSKGKNNV